MAYRRSVFFFKRGARCASQVESYSCESERSSWAAYNKERIDSEDTSIRDDESCSCSLNDKLDSSSSEQAPPPAERGERPLSQVDELSEPSTAPQHPNAHQVHPSPQCAKHDLNEQVSRHDLT